MYLHSGRNTNSVARELVHSLHSFISRITAAWTCLCDTATVTIDQSIYPVQFNSIHFVLFYFICHHVRDKSCSVCSVSNSQLLVFCFFGRWLSAVPSTVAHWSSPLTGLSTGTYGGARQSTSAVSSRQTEIFQTQDNERWVLDQLRKRAVSNC